MRTIGSWNPSDNLGIRSLLNKSGSGKSQVVELFQPLRCLTVNRFPAPIKLDSTCINGLSTRDYPPQTRSFSNMNPYYPIKQGSTLCPYALFQSNLRFRASRTLPSASAPIAAWSQIQSPVSPWRTMIIFCTCRPFPEQEPKIKKNPSPE